MLEWFNTDVLMQLLRDHPHWAVFGSFLTSFLESLAIIGAIMPGAVVMSVIGFLIAVSVLDGGSIYSALALGAVLGSLASYGAGRYFCDYLRRLSFFRKNPRLLIGSEQFFSKHGGKSIFIGQFLGPMRAVMPMTAGMLRMSPINFVLVAIPSAVMWSVLYTVPGFLLGALSVELPPEVMMQFAGISLLVLMVLWLVVWFIQFVCAGIWRWWYNYLQTLWFNWRDKQNGGSSFTYNLVHYLAKVDNQDGYKQLVRISEIVFLLLLLAILVYVMQFPSYQWFEEGLYHFTQSCRVAFLEPIMICFTCLGDDRFVAVVWLITGLWLLYRRQYCLLQHWAALFLAAWGSVSLLKYLVVSVRPLGVLHGLSVASFPSGHVMLSIALFGGVGIVVAREWPVFKRRIWLAVFVLVSIIAVSRLYFGAHWLKDILAGVLIGSTLVLLTSTSYYRRTVTVDPHVFLAAFGVGLLLVYLPYTVINWHALSSRYGQVWPITITNFNSLVSDSSAEVMGCHQHNGPNSCTIPRYRINRLGEVIEPFNMVLVGNLSDFSQALQRLGWRRESLNGSLRNAIQTFFGTSLRSYRYLFSPLHRGQQMQLLVNKPTARPDVVLVMQLWSAGIDLVDSHHAVWIGNISFHHQQPPLISRDGLLSLFSKQHYLSALHQLNTEANQLESYGFKLFDTQAAPRHNSLFHWMDWGGQRLVIQQH